MHSSRRIKVTSALAAVTLTLAACGDEGGQDNEEAEGGGQDFTSELTMGTGGQAGTYFPLGTEYANIFEENIEDVSVNAIETGASVENLGQIYQGDMQLGITQSDTATAAIEGTADFEGAAVDNVGWIGSMYPEAAHIITLEGSGIESVQDLEGKRVAVGPPGSGTRAVSDAILEAAGIEEGDFEMFEEEFGDSQGLLQDGNLDASIFVVGTPNSSLNELAASNEVDLISLDQEMADSIAGDSNFESYTIEAGTYDFLEEDVTTLSVFAALVASTDQVSEDVGYEITKTMYEQADQVTLPQGELINVEDALVGQGEVPLHPGAERYLQEEGVTE